MFYLRKGCQRREKSLRPIEDLTRTQARQFPHPIRPAAGWDADTALCKTAMNVWLPFMATLSFQGSSPGRLKSPCEGQIHYVAFCSVVSSGFTEIPDGCRQSQLGASNIQLRSDPGDVVFLHRSFQPAGQGSLSLSKTGDADLDGFG